MAEQCPFGGVNNPEVECDYKGTEVMIGHHIEAKHREKAPIEKKEEKKKEDETEKKKGKRIEAKPPKFMENETREEFRRKEDKFEAYVTQSTKY